MEAAAWYRDAIIYEVHVRAFCDSNGDGIGDFPGLTSKLDYLRDLGITAIWLLPFYPSPLRDDGYDIADYTGVNPDYGTLADFKRFLREAHQRGLRVITELVLNHTSDQHPWFQRARTSPPGSRWRDWYVWSDDPQRYADARIIFPDFETSNWTWDDQAGAYYWHRFYSQQPDLNFENPYVRREMLKIMSFWLEMGVDGLRLDAVPYLFEEDGTSCENLPATHAYLREVRQLVDERFGDRMLLAEANQWPEDAVDYFGDGDECHMCFHFPLMPRLFMALQRENRYPVVEILQQTPDVPEGCQWAVFLRNHDELTLEMVTEEERDYMWRHYAKDRQSRINLGIRRRLAPLLEFDRRRIELLNVLLLSLPGTPVLYYGDEIGMGDNVFLGDRNGVRTPMQWSSDRNAGFSRANPQGLYLPPIIDPAAHYEAVNVESQHHTRSSLLWWTRRALALRRQHAVFGRGDLDMLHPDNPHVLAFLRTLGDQVVLVVANLSRHAQSAEVDLTRFAGIRPTEVFGQSTFPPVEDQPYRLALGPFGYYWLSLGQPVVVPDELPAIHLGQGQWRDVFGELRQSELTDAVAAALPRQRWFLGKHRSVVNVLIDELAPLEVRDTEAAALVVVEVRYRAGEPERYVVPLVVTTGDAADVFARQHPDHVLARLERGPATALLCDGMPVSATTEALFRLMSRARRLTTRAGRTVQGSVSERFRELSAGMADRPECHRIFGEQTNSSAVVGERFVLKLFRKLSSGVNPDLELGRHLARVHDHAGSGTLATLVGAIELQSRHDADTIAVLHRLVAHEGVARTRFVEDLGRHLEDVLANDRPFPGPPPERDLDQLLAAARSDPTPPDDDMSTMADAIGRRLGELHRQLADSALDRSFAPEVFTDMYVRSIQQSFRNRVHHTWRLLREQGAALDPATREHAALLEARQDEALAAGHEATRQRLTGRRIRIHGAMGLDEILWTGREPVFIDFEGEPTLSIGERRLKRSALRDVAGLIRSVDAASHEALAGLVSRGLVADGSAPALRLEADRWFARGVTLLLAAYLGAMDGSGLLPTTDAETAALLRMFYLDLALDAVGRSLRHRPDEAGAAIQGALRLLPPHPA
jgi:maltose alpha-D-glucosyltransferase / alpha-amylase